MTEPRPVQQNALASRQVSVSAKHPYLCLNVPHGRSGSSVQGFEVLEEDDDEDVMDDDDEEEMENALNDEDDEMADQNDDEEEGDYSASPEEKKIFGHHKFQQLQQQQHHSSSSIFGATQPAVNREALKQGGIIIQKLKVRRGGIAIAGPGGVATAGSGGTAIVGPGGYALTHPRSLTIAGPGAKVIAIPSDVDLKDALQRTNLKDQSFPEEGKIVATGPTVYYSPGTGPDEEQ